MIFFKQNSQQKIIGTIIKSISSGVWIVKDDSNRSYKVTSSRNWNIGQRVTVINNQIIDIASSSKQITKYTV